MSAEEQAGKFFILGGSSPEELEEIVRTYRPAGIFLTSAFRGKGLDYAREAVERAKEASPHPLLVTTDNEGGYASWIAEGYPSPAELGAMSLRQMYETVRKMAADLYRVGINLNFAPVVDLASNPENQVIVGKKRSFGRDPYHVALYATLFAKAQREEGVGATAKHFLAQGRTPEDPHQEMSHIDEPLSAIREELIPYEALIVGGVEAVMVGHILFRAEDNLPVTLSEKMINGLLRKGLGYDGVVITDDLNMGALARNFPIEETVVRALNAGCDLLLICFNRENMERAYRAVYDALKAGKIADPEAHLNRIDALMDRLKLQGLLANLFAIARSKKGS